MLAIVMAVQTSVNSRPTAYTLLRVMMAQEVFSLVMAMAMKREFCGVGGRPGVRDY